MYMLCVRLVQNNHVRVPSKQMEEQAERDPTCTYIQGSDIYRSNLGRCEEREVTEEKHHQERAESAILG